MALVLRKGVLPIQEKSRSSNDGKLALALFIIALTSAASSFESDGKSVNASPTVRGRSRKTTSSPRLKISTIFELTRNSFGSRTAWLFPETNTVVVLVLVSVGSFLAGLEEFRRYSFCISYRDIQHNYSDQPILIKETQTY